jgi:hypothetical protein
MDRDGRIATAEAFGSAYVAIEQLIRGLPPEALAFVPKVPEAWSINDHLVHLLDADAAVWFRIRAAVAEPGKAIVAWDEEAWHARLNYGAMDGRACLAAAAGLRTLAAGAVRSLADRDWDGFWVQHPERGRMSLAELLGAYREHVAFHAPFVKRNRDAWQASRGGSA